MIHSIAAILKSSIVFGTISAVLSCNNSGKTYKDWKVYGGSSENIKYSALEQIDTANVKTLRVAWEYSSGQASATNTTDMKTNAIIIDGILYGLNPQLKLFALDAATGKEKWVFNPMNDSDVKGAGYFGMNVCRGVTFYADKNNAVRFLTARQNKDAVWLTEQ